MKLYPTLGGSEQAHATIQIGANFACALTHLRYPDQPRTLWVDAVCINQNGVDERNAQVKRMGSIYSLAGRVVVWLGQEALSTLKYFGGQVEFLVDEFIGDAPGAKEPKWWDTEYRLPYDERTWSCLTPLFRCLWFSRIWILHEALLASQQAVVQCGSYSVPWYTIRKAMIVLAKKRIPPGIAVIGFVSQGGLLTESPRGLPCLLLWTRYRQCTDPRDEIYGILGLVSPSISKKIQPEYSLSTSQVYMNALFAHLDLVERLELLRHCRIEQRCGNGPSRIPNWAVVHSSSLFGHRMGHSRQPVGHSAVQTQYLPPYTLGVVGIQCARVCSISSVASDDANEVFQTIRQWELEGLQSKHYISGDSLFDAFLEVIFSRSNK
ncbi:MAG: hypothetical protein M1813_004150 [Trichoglossum hirsutum]|nr:MAG: hypothetical protein M1813_004150 [Trichoglossum hirsutum]